MRAPIQDDGADADQAIVFNDRAAVQHHAMAHGDAIADGEGDAFVKVQHGVVLDIGFRADANGSVIAARRDVGPQAGPGAYGDVSDDDGAGVDIGGDSDIRSDAAERTNHLEFM